MKKIKTAQIGVGYWGPNLLRNLLSNPRCELVAVADASAERRHFLRQQFPGLNVVESPEVVFADQEIEAVVIATPARTHHKLVCQALSTGKHVLVEKPMAMSVAEVDEIGRMATAQSLVAMVGHTFLFNPAVRYLKQLVEQGDIGEIRYIYCQRLNLGRIRSDVDALWNLAPHDISIIQYLLGDRPPAGVVCEGMDFIQPGIDDVVFLTLSFISPKILAHVHVSWLDPHKVRSVTVVGSKKMVVYDDVAENKITIFDKGIEPRARLGEKMDYDTGTQPAFVHRSGDIHIPSIEWQEPLKVEIGHFFDCIEGLAECLTGPRHAREVVRILEMANAVCGEKRKNTDERVQ